jgi:hypothetical protein
LINARLLRAVGEHLPYSIEPGAARARDSLVGDRHSHASEELIGQLDFVQRSLLFVYVWLEQGPHQLYISPLRATRVKRSNRRIHRERPFPMISLLREPG